MFNSPDFSSCLKQEWSDYQSITHIWHALIGWLSRLSCVPLHVYGEDILFIGMSLVLLTHHFRKKRKEELHLVVWDAFLWGAWTSGFSTWLVTIFRRQKRWRYTLHKNIYIIYIYMTKQDFIIGTNTLSWFPPSHFRESRWAVIFWENTLFQHQLKSSHFVRSMCQETNATAFKQVHLPWPIMRLATACVRVAWL